VRSNRTSELSLTGHPACRAIPVDVSVTISSVPAYQVFQALGEEAGTKATVDVDPLHHQVEVIHHV